MAYRRYYRRRRYYGKAPIEEVFEILILLIVFIIKGIFHLFAAVFRSIRSALSQAPQAQPKVKVPTPLFVKELESEVPQETSWPGATPISVAPPTFAEESLYEKRYRLMNNSEATFHNVLKQAIPPEFHIFPKMRIADIINTKDGKGYYKQRNKILPKHVDFVVCTPDFKPLVAIEIDGGSHNRKDRVERDRQVDEIFQDAGVPLEHIRVGEDFSLRCQQLQNYFLSK